MRYRVNKKVSRRRWRWRRANAEANRIRNKKQYVPLPFGGGHKYW